MCSRSQEGCDSMLLFFPSLHNSYILSPKLSQNTRQACQYGWVNPSALLLFILFALKTLVKHCGHKPTHTLAKILWLSHKRPYNTTHTHCTHIDLGYKERYLYVWHLETANADTIMFSTHPTHLYSCSSNYVQTDQGCVSPEDIWSSVSVQNQKSNINLILILTTSCIILSPVLSECTGKTTVIQWWRFIAYCICIFSFCILVFSVYICVCVY